MDEPLRRRLEIYIICMLLMAAVLVAYSGAHNNGFAYDDVGYLVVNSHVHSGLTPAGLGWAFTTYYSGNWHPMTWISHMIDCGLYAARPMGHHLTSVWLHLVNTLLLFGVILTLTRARWRSAFVALLFGVHPLHVESVAWISERKDVLSTFFGLLAILSYVAFTRKPVAWRYAVTAVLFVLGLMSKPMLVTLPILLLLLDWWPLGRMAAGKRGLAGLIWEKAPLFAISAVSAVVTVIAQRSGATVANLNQVPLPARLGNAVVSYVVYIRKMLWPSDLAAFYPHLRGGLPWWEVAVAGVLLIAITVIVLRSASRRYLPAGWLWYLVTLLPVIGIVQVGGQSMADRYTYIPLIGLFVMIAWGVPDLLRGRAVALLTVAAVLVTLPLIVVTRTQVSYWKSNETLFAHAVKITRDNWVANYTLGLALADTGKWHRALPHARESVRIQPYNVASSLLLGRVYTHLDRFDEAVDQFGEAIVRDPYSAEAHARMADALWRRGDTAQAIEEANIALDLDPDNATARTVLENAAAHVPSR